MKYYKLIRDKIPGIIKARGETPVTHIANQEEYSKMLRLKLREEVAEFIADEKPEELADILEVIYQIGEEKGVTPKQLEDIRVKKVEDKGAFKEKIVLDEIR